jgi:hypothetical protein
MTENVSSDQTVILSDVRTSYFYGFEPYKGDNGDSYCSHFLMAPDHPGVALIKAAQRRAATAMWKDGAEAMLQALAKQDRLCLHDGDTSKPGVDGYKGMLFVSGNSKKRFTIVDGDRSPLTAADGRPYSGCYVNAIVQVWAQQNKWGKRINAQSQAFSSCVTARALVVAVWLLLRSSAWSAVPVRTALPPRALRPVWSNIGHASRVGTSRSRYTIACGAGSANRIKHASRALAVEHIATRTISTATRGLCKGADYMWKWCYTADWKAIIFTRDGIQVTTRDKDVYSSQDAQSFCNYLNARRHFK